MKTKNRKQQPETSLENLGEALRPENIEPTPTEEIDRTEWENVERFNQEISREDFSR